MVWQPIQSAINYGRWSFRCCVWKTQLCCIKWSNNLSSHRFLDVGTFIQTHCPCSTNSLENIVASTNQCIEESALQYCYILRQVTLKMCATSDSREKKRNLRTIPFQSSHYRNIRHYKEVGGKEYLGKPSWTGNLHFWMTVFERKVNTKLSDRRGHFTVSNSWTNFYLSVLSIFLSSKQVKLLALIV